MNCSHCEQHILATMQVAWNGGNYHADCIGEAIAQRRAAENQEDREIKEVFEDFDEFEDLQDEFQEENFDDLEPGEILDKPNVIVPEIVTGFPNEQRREVAIGDVMANVNQQYIAERQPSNGTLMAHCGTVKVDRHFLAQIELPDATDTFQPIAHSALVDAIEESLSYRRIRLVRSEFAVSKDGMKMFGLLEVNHELDGIRFAIGLRNANDKSMRLGMVAGYRVFVCDNMSLAGDFKPLLAKHTKNLDLIESVSMGIDRIQRSWQPLSEAIKLKKETKLCTENAKLFI